MVKVRRAVDWLMGIRGDYDEEARRLLRRSFWIGFGSVGDLSGKVTARRLRENQREWDRYWEKRRRELDPELEEGYVQLAEWFRVTQAERIAFRDRALKRDDV